MIRVVLACMLALPLVAGAGEKKEIPVGPTDAVTIELRDAWKEDGAPDPNTISAGIAGRMQVLVTALPPRAGDGGVRKLVQEAADNYAPQSVEKKADLKPLKGAQAEGFYFTVTDPAPGPGDFLVMRQGAVAVGGAWVTFTVLFNKGAEREADDATTTVAAMTYGKRLQPLPASGIEQTATELRLGIPSTKPVISIPPEDWKVDEQKRNATGGVYYLLTSVKRRLVFSVFIEKKFECKTADECLASALKNPMARNAKDVQKGAEGPFKIAHYFLDQPGGMPVAQANVLASTMADGLWFDVHLSMTEPRRPDMALLLDFLKLIAVK
jgi:hypothetical protein